MNSEIRIFRSVGQISRMCSSLKFFSGPQKRNMRYGTDWKQCFSSDISPVLGYSRPGYGFADT